MLINDILITSACSIAEALKQLDATAKQILLVVDEHQKFIGTITDGDIRRGILDGKGLSGSVEAIVNTAPLVLKEGSAIEHIVEIAKQKQLAKIPVINHADQVVDLYDIYEAQYQAEKNNAVVLMAGGLGSRLSTLTRDRPKPMLDVGNKPILETIIANFAKHGFKKIFLSVNYKANIIKDHFGDGRNFGVDIEYLEENQRLGTAGALSLLDETKIDAPFFVMNGDILTNVNFEQLLSYHFAQGAQATVGVREYDFQVPYGVIQSDNGYVSSILEKPVHTFFVSAGIYLLDPKLLALIPKDTFFDMPTLLNMAVEQKRSVASFPIHEYWLDIGQVVQYEKANNDYRDIFK